MIIRRTIFRTALLWTAMIALAYMLGAILALRLLESQLNLRLDAQVIDHLASIREEYAGDSPRALTHVVARHLAVSRQASNIYLLRTSKGKVLIANFDADLPVRGLSTVTSEMLGLTTATSYRVLRESIEDMDLIIGLSTEDSRELQTLVIKVASFAILLTLGVLLCGGVWLTRSAQRRIDRTRVSLDAIAAGELNVRLPLSNRGDDVDRLAANVNTMIDQLQSTLASIQQVSTDIAHDLKTPISRLFIVLEEALDYDATGEPVGPSLVEARSELLAINATFDAILRLARIERQTRRERFIEVIMSELLAQIVEHWQPVAEDKQHTLMFKNLSTGTGTVTADRDLLTQLFVNLITNALNHCPPGAQIRIVLEDSKSMIAVLVTDDGPGIPIAERTNVFRRLYRLDASRSTPGNGLGLSLVKVIAQLHQGTVTLSDNAPGLVATIQLPKSQSDTSA